MLFPPRNILAPTDFSDSAEPAIAYAFELAKTVGARVHVLHAYMLSAYPEHGLVAGPLTSELKELGNNKLRQLADKYQASGAVGQLVLKMGDPRDVIAQAISALDADLVVMGTHGRRGLSRMLLGSVASHVVRTSSCPVLVIPPAEKS
jgi:universal stress protein A